MCSANGGQKDARVAILFSDKTDFKTKKFNNRKEKHYIIMKGTVQKKISQL